MQRATQKHNKAASRTSKAKPAPKFVPITPDDPRAAELIRAANEYLNPKPRPKAKPTDGRVIFAAEQAKALAHDAEYLCMMVGAVKRLAWAMTEGDDDETAAAEMALTAISEVCSFKADTIVRALGGMGSNGYQDDLDRYARAAGYILKREAQQ